MCKSLQASLGDAAGCWQLPRSTEVFLEHQVTFSERWTHTHRQLYRLQVDPVRNLVYVKGQVPGHKGNFVEVRDAVMQQHVQPERPFPTYLGQALADIMLAPPGIKDPYEVVAS